MNELLILSRAVHFGACLLLLALYAVRLLVERRAGVNARAAGACLAVAAGSGFLWFWVSVAGMSGGGMMDSINMDLFKMVVTQTMPGAVWAIRAGLALVLAVTLCIPPLRRWGIVPALFFVGSLAWLGHMGAADGARHPWMLCADVAHLLAASLWPAGLFPFGALLLRQLKAGAMEEAHAAAVRFSAMSLATVSILAATGIVNSCFLIGSIHNLMTSDYGRLLLMKTAFFAAAVALGARNLLVHKPCREMGEMARTVWVEAALGTAAVAVVAIMGTLPPSAPH